MIGVSPDRLELNFSQNGASAQNIFLKNLGAAPIRITVASEKYSQYLEIEPPETVLAAAGEQPVRINAKEGKNFSTNLEIVSHDNSEIATGVKIPLTVSGNKFIVQYEWAVIIAAAFLVTAFVYLFKHKSSFPSP